VRLLTEVRGVVVLRTVETHRRQVGHSVETGSLVDALPFGHDVDVVEHLVESGAGLVDRADDGSSASCQLFQNADALRRRRTVQAPGEKSDMMWRKWARKMHKLHKVKIWRV
jgi:hypothetical protein